MLYIAQFTLGLGTGSLGVTRSFIVEQTIAEKRTYRLARLSALQYAGFYFALVFFLYF
jgi:ceroid-lipofuscinosis MFS transporter 7